MPAHVILAGAQVVLVLLNVPVVWNPVHAVAVGCIMFVAFANGELYLIRYMGESGEEHGPIGVGSVALPPPEGTITDVESDAIVY